MTDLNLTALMQAIDDAGRAADVQQSVVAKIKDALCIELQKLHDLELTRDTLMRALALTRTDEAPKESAPADKPKPEKRDALADCIAAIRAKFMLPLNPEVSDRMAQEQLEKLGFKFRLPTIRNAIAAINKESRAGTPERSDANQERTDAQEPSPSSPPEAGAGPNLDMPVFLRRTKETAE